MSVASIALLFGLLNVFACIAYAFLFRREFMRLHIRIWHLEHRINERVAEQWVKEKLSKHQGEGL